MFEWIILSCLVKFEIIIVFHPRFQRGVRGLCIWVCLSVCLSVCPFVCLSECVTQKQLLRLTRFFYARSITQVVRASSTWWSGSVSGLDNLLKDFSPLRDTAKYGMKVCHDVKRALWWNKCIMTSHVHHSERRSAISDCNVVCFCLFFVFSMVILKFHSFGWHAYLASFLLHKHVSSGWLADLPAIRCLWSDVISTREVGWSARSLWCSAKGV